MLHIAPSSLSPPLTLALALAFVVTLSILDTAESAAFQPSTTNTKASCFDARIVDNSQRYCTMASWNTAHIYATVNFTNYDPGPPLSDAVQNHLAVNLYATYIKNYPKSVSTECSSALTRLACVSAFPECSLSGNSVSSISYYLPCKLQCEQANARCPFITDCTPYPAVNCMLSVPTGFFVIDPVSGPFEPLEYIYAISLAFWTIFAVTWNYLTFVRYKNSCVAFCRVVSGIPIIKVVVLAFGTVFWSTGVSWKMYSFWMGVALVNTQLVYETGQMLIFLLIAKGWTITRENFAANEWRGVIIALSAFYMSNSIILVLQSSILSVLGFWVANLILYGSMFLYIYTCVCYQLTQLRRQVSLLSDEMPPDIVHPLRMKYTMYCVFLVLVLVSAAMEICSHALLYADGRIWVVLLDYEISNVIILGTMGAVFRPQEYSPFFFMVPARLNDTRTRPIPILEAADDGDEDPEVDLAPLLQTPDDSHQAPGKMIVLRNPDLAVSVGISAAMVQSIARGEQGDGQWRGRGMDIDHGDNPPNMIHMIGRRVAIYLGARADRDRGQGGQGRAARGWGWDGPEGGQNGAQGQNGGQNGGPNVGPRQVAVEGIEGGGRLHHHNRNDNGNGANGNNGNNNNPNNGPNNGANRNPPPRVGGRDDELPREHDQFLVNVQRRRFGFLMWW